MDWFTAGLKEINEVIVLHQVPVRDEMVDWSPPGFLMLTALSMASPVCWKYWYEHGIM